MSCYVRPRTPPAKKPLELKALFARFELNDKVGVYWPGHPGGTYEVRNVRGRGKSAEYQLGKDGSAELYEQGAWVNQEHIMDA